MVTRKLVRRGFAAGILCVGLLLPACGDGPETEGFAGESIFRIEIPGAANGRVSTGSDGTVTKLFDVAGDWEQVSVALARLVQDEGWTVESLNCVGTGNDVIAKKRVGGVWLLLESGAGGRGAGLIVGRAPMQSPPEPLTVIGRCPEALERAVD